MVTVLKGKLLEVNIVVINIKNSMKLLKTNFKKRFTKLKIGIIKYLLSAL